MPDVVCQYADHRNLKECQLVIDDILTTLRDDFAKYKKKAPVLRIRETFDSIVAQAGSKFKYSNISQNSMGVAYKDTLELLMQAGIAYKIFHSSARGLPLGAQVDLKKFKVLFLDTGMFQRIMGLDLSPTFAIG